MCSPDTSEVLSNSGLFALVRVYVAGWRAYFYHSERSLVYSLWLKKAVAGSGHSIEHKVY